jgi:uncharacterized protein YkwD
MKINLINILVLIALASCAPLEQALENSPRQAQADNHDLGVENAASGKGTLKTPCAKVLALKSAGSLKSRSNLKTRFLKAHNQVRELYAVAPLVWDDNLAKYAQAWANELKTRYNCRLNHRQNLGRTEGKSLGENLASYSTSKKLAPSAFASSPDFATFAWAQECSDYKAASNSCTPGKQCGHFTQVVWQKSKKVGCGVAVCEGGMRTEVWVCNYDPPGNMTINGVKQKPY